MLTGLSFEYINHGIYNKYKLVAFFDTGKICVVCVRSNQELLLFSVQFIGTYLPNNYLGTAQYTGKKNLCTAKL